MARGDWAVLEGASKVFGDTSFFFAVLNPGDPKHRRAREISQAILNLGIELVTTWEVVVECVTLLRYRLGFRASQKFLTEAVPAFTLFHPGEAERRAAVDFYLKRSRSRRLSLCDAISYVVVSTRLAWAPCLSFDRDFQALGLTVAR